jgi:hypothetical protein
MMWTLQRELFLNGLSQWLSFQALLRLIGHKGDRRLTMNDREHLKEASIQQISLASLSLLTLKHLQSLRFLI